MTPSLFSKIRTQCAAVAEVSRWITIDIDRVMQYPETLRLNVGTMSHTAEHHLLNKGDNTLVFFLILDSVNFGSGYFPYLRKERELSGYFTVAKALKDQCEENGIPGPDLLRQLTARECAKIFRQEVGNPHLDELMQLFALALNQLGDWVISQHGGDYLGFLRGADSADGAVRSLLEMPYFRDAAMYGNIEVPFLKRAQILLHDMSIAEPKHALLQFGDIDDLTVFADNVLPYVLKSDRVLRYHDWLERRIQNEELIGSGSFEEIELRACSVHAVELLHQVVAEEFTKMPVRQLDYCLWNRGQELKKLNSGKRHRTRCVFY